VKKPTKEQVYLAVFGASFVRMFEDEHARTTECPINEKDCDRIAEEADAVAELAADAAERIGLLYVEPAVKTCENCKYGYEINCHEFVGICIGVERWEPADE